MKLAVVLLACVALASARPGSPTYEDIETRGEGSARGIDVGVSQRVRSLKNNKALLDKLTRELKEITDAAANNGKNSNEAAGSKSSESSEKSSSSKIVDAAKNMPEFPGGRIIEVLSEMFHSLCGGMDDSNYMTLMGPNYVKMAAKLKSMLGPVDLPTIEQVLQNFFDYHVAEMKMEPFPYPEEAVAPINKFIYEEICKGDDGLLTLFGTSEIAFASSPGYLAFMEEAEQGFDSLLNEDGDVDAFMILKAIKDILCYKSDNGYLRKHLVTSFDLISFMLSASLDLPHDNYLTADFMLANLQKAMDEEMKAKEPPKENGTPTTREMLRILLELTQKKQESGIDGPKLAKWITDGVCKADDPYAVAAEGVMMGVHGSPAFDMLMAVAAEHGLLKKRSFQSLVW